MNSSIVLNIIERRNKKNNNKYLEIRNKMDYSFSELEKNSKFAVHLNIKNLTLIDIDKHKNFFLNISTLLKGKYPNRLLKCYVYNSSFLISQFSYIINMFLDKDTLKKIEIVKTY